jgi:hypothetical protein
MESTWMKDQYPVHGYQRWLQRRLFDNNVLDAEMFNVAYNDRNHGHIMDMNPLICLKKYRSRP